MTEQEELIKLIDGHIDIERKLGCDSLHLAGMRTVRWLVYNFFNAPKEEETQNDQQDFGL